MEIIMRITCKNNIDWRFLEVFQSYSTIRRYSSYMVPTVVVTTAKRNYADQSWVECCAEIRELLLSHGLEVSVEMSNPEEGIEPASFPVLPTDPVVPRWSEIFSRVLSLTQRDGWLALECFRRGKGLTAEENPVEVVLTIPYESTRDWKPVREGIVQILDLLSLPQVGVAIVRGEVWRSMDAPGSSVSRNDAWKDVAQCGLSVGPHGSDLSVSTLGAFIDVHLPASNEWRKLGLTCFHGVTESTNRDSMSDQEKDCEYFPSPTAFSGYTRCLKRIQCIRYLSWPASRRCVG